MRAVATLLVCVATVLAQTSRTDGHDGSIIGSSLVFRPLAAAIYEPRMGFQFQPTTERLRLDIGYSADVWRSALERSTGESSSEAVIAAGVDGFTYTRLRSEANLKFPVETVDYMFGVNASYRKQYDSERAVAVRVRLSHISAHLADGYADSSGMLLARPFVYSREFCDIIAAYEWLAPNVRVYGGGTFLFTVKELPKPVGRLIPQAGIEWYHAIVLPVFAAYDIRLVRVGDATVPSHAVQLGILLGSRTPSLALSGYYYSGYSIHGMFFDRRDRYWALGVQVLF
ncbi:MAG: DUF1207 domain-containing protein [Chlorobi bacterium]|nr:DUF1207 domain-containing protein [Chlorobiota bacterium]